jgi:hypothetical protein
MIVTEALDECATELDRTSSNLACITNLLLLLARLTTGMEREEMDKLMSALSPVMHGGQEQVRIRLLLCDTLSHTVAQCDKIRTKL